MSMRRMLSMLLAFCMIVSMVPANVFAAETETVAPDGSASADLEGVVESPIEPERPALVLDERMMVQTPEDGSLLYVTFTPTESCTYWFASHMEGNATDTEAYFYDGDMNHLYYNDQGNVDGNNFGFSYYLEANHTYILATRYYGGTPKEYEISVTHAPDTLVTTVVQERTCIQDGLVRIYCTVCNYAKEEVLPAQHTIEYGECIYCDYESVIELDVPQLANITEEGGYAYFRFTPSTSCTYIFYSETEDYPDTYGYLFDADWNELSRDDDGNGNGDFLISQHLEAGKTYILCACFYSEYKTGSFEVNVIHSRSLYDHTEWIREKTCTQDGILRFTCNCGISFDVIQPAEHTYEISESVPATCRQAGYAVFICGGCGDSYTENYPMGDHNFSVLLDTKTVTCVEDGYSVYSCSYGCGETQTVTSSALGHRFYNGRCSNCDEVAELSGLVIEGMGWRLSGADGVLHITGAGVMPDYYDTQTRPWDEYRDWITGIEVESGIEEIGSFAFYDMPQVRTVSIPGVERIGEYAFAYMLALTEVTLPSTITELEWYTFAYSGLTEITIPGNVQTVGRGAFESCGNLTTVVMENGVEFLEDSAFYNCTKLANVTLAPSLIEIHYGIFYGCKALRSINLPTSLQHIYSLSFAYTGLETVEIPASVTELESDAFDYCENLTAVNVNEDNDDYFSVDGVVYGEQGTTLWIVPCTRRTVTVRDSVISVEALLCDHIQSVVFEGNVPHYWAGWVENLDAKVYYPVGNETWHTDVLHDLGVGLKCYPLPELVILAGPVDVTVDAGDPVLLSVQSLGATEHTWQRLDQKTGQWVDEINGDHMEFVAAYEQTGEIFRCAVTNGTDTIYTDEITLTVRPVWEVEKLGQQEEMLILANSYGTVRFTADYTGLYILRWNVTQGDTYSVDVVTDLDSDQVWSNWVPMTRFFVEEGKEYELRIRNSSGSGSARVTLTLEKPIVMTEGVVSNVQAGYNHYGLLQFVPQESGWYQLSGIGFYSLVGRDLTAPEMDYDTGHWWLEAGQIYYIGTEGRTGEPITLPVMIEKMKELQPGETVSGAFAWSGVDRYLYFTPAESGMYRMSVSDPDALAVHLFFPGYSTDFDDDYVELEAGVRYKIRIYSYNEEYVAYTATLEQMPNVAPGYTDTVDLNYGDRYEVYFTPDTTDYYIFTATAPDGTLLNAYINHQGSYYSLALAAGQTYLVEFNNQSGVNYTDVVLSIQHQPTMEEGVDTAMKIVDSNWGHLGFVPQETGVYRFSGAYNLYVTGAYSNFNEVEYEDPVGITYKAYGDELSQAWYYLEAGRHYYVTANAFETDTAFVRADKVATTAVGEGVSVVLDPEEPALILYEITEADRYVWTWPGDAVYGGNFWESMDRITENGTEYVEITRHGAEDAEYFVVDLQPGLYALSIWNHSCSVDRTVTLQKAAVPETFSMNDSYVLPLGSATNIGVGLQPWVLSTVSAVTWEMGTPGIIEIVEAWGDHISVSALATGTTTLTGTLPNGYSFTTTVTVKAPIDGEFGQPLEVAVAANETETVIFRPQETGYYVLAGTNAGSWYSLNLEGIVTSIVDNGVVYTYVYWDAGREYSYALVADGVDTVITVEARKAETPTEINLPDSVEVLTGKETVVELRFGSPWEFAPVEWRNDELFWYNNFYLSVWIRGDDTMSTVLTAVCGDLVGQCTVNVIDAMPVELGQTLSWDMDPWGTTRIRFTPGTSGYYLFELGTDLLVNMTDDSGNWISFKYGGQNGYAWLTAGTPYTLEISNNTGGYRNLQIQVHEPEALSLDQETEFLIHTGSYAMYSFTPETSGYYTVFRPNGPGIDFYLHHDGYGSPINQVYADEGVYFSTWMEAGEEYCILYTNESGMQQTSLRVTAAVAPEQMYPDSESYLVPVGESVITSIYFEPAYAMADIRVEIADPSVLTLTNQSGGSFWFRSLKAGTTTVTYTCGDMSATVTYTVVEIQEVSLDETVGLQIPQGESAFVQVEIPESGFYIVNLDPSRAHVSMYSCNGNWTGYGELCSEGQNYDRYYLEQGSYTFRVYFDSYAEGDVDVLPVNLLIKQAETPTELRLPETLSGVVGSRIDLTLDFGSPWAFTPVYWDLVGYDVVSWVYEPTPNEASLQAVAPGTATVTVHGVFNDLSATCTITVEELTLTLGQDLPITVPHGGGTVIAGFTPAESGYYFFPLDGYVQLNVLYPESYEHVANYEYNNGLVCYLEGGREYAVAYYNYSGMERYFVARVEVPTALNLGDTVNVEMAATDCAVFTAQVEETGWYLFQSSQYNIGIQVFGDNWAYVTNTSENAKVKLEAGQTYLVAVTSWANAYVRTNFSFTECPEPTSIQLSGKGGTSVLVGGTLYLSADIYPYYAHSELTWSVDEALLTIDEVDEYGNIWLVGKAVGETTVTVTTANGLSDSVVVSVVDPEILTENEPVTAPVSYGETAYFGFTAPEDGIYAFRTDRSRYDEFFVSGDCYYYGQLEEDGQYYRYYELEQGWTVVFSVTSWDESRDRVTMEVRKAQEPTAIVLPETFTGYVGTDVSIPVRYASPWEFPTLGYDATIEGEGVMLYVFNTFNIVAYLEFEGTATLTVRYAAMSDTCEITVEPKPSLQEGEIMEVLLPADGDFSTTFTPAESGYYVLRGSLGMEMQIHSTGTVCPGRNNCMTYYLEGGQTYTVSVYDLRSQERSVQLEISRVEALRLDEQVDANIPSGWADVYRFIPEESGYYVFRLDTLDAYFNLWDMAYNQPSFRTMRIDNSTWLSVYLEAEVTYFITANVYEDTQDYAGAFGVQLPPDPEYIMVNYEGPLQAGGYAYFELQFDPGYSLQDFTVTVEDESVAVLDEQGVSYFSLQGLKAGTTAVTVTAGGYSRTIEITVTEPIRATLVPNEPLTLTLEPDSVVILDFSVAGNYVLSFANENDDLAISDGPINGAVARDGVTYVFSRGLTEDVEYPYTLRYYGYDTAAVTFLLQEEAPAEQVYLDKTEVTLTVGEYLDLNLMVEPVTAWATVYNWRSTDPSVLAAFTSGTHYATFYAQKPGKVTVYATLDGNKRDGVQMICEVTVVAPETTALTLNEYAEHIMLDGSDYGFYTFTAPESGRYFFATMSAFDSFLEIYDTQWNTLASNDDYNSLDSGLWLDLQKDQTVIVCARPLGYGGETVTYLKTIVSTTDDVYDVFHGLELSLDEPVLLNVWEYITMEFTPETSGWYAFCVQGEGYYWLCVDIGDDIIADGEVFTSNPVKGYLEAGQTYRIMLYRNSDIEESVYFWIEEAIVVTGLEITNAPARDTFVRGFIEDDLAGLEMKVTWSDGTVTDHAFDEDGYYIGGQAMLFDWEEHGDTATVILSVGDASATYEVNLIDNPVEKIEIDDSDVKPWVEGAGKLTWLDGYSTQHLLKDLKIRVTYTDGTSEVIGMDDEILGYQPMHYDTVIEGLGGTNETTIGLLGAYSERYTIEFIESPVAKLEIVSQPDTLILGRDDRVSADGELLYFKHDWGMGFEGMVIRITYTDGTVEDVSYADMFYPDRADDFFRFPEWNGYAMEAQQDVYGDGNFAYWHLPAWEVPENGEIPMILHYMGKYVEFTVEVTGKTPVAITEEPADVTVYEGEKAVFTVTATGEGLTYQWQYRVTADGEWIDLEETGNTLTVVTTLAQNGYEYRCVVTDADGDSVGSAAAKLTVKQKMTITGQPADVTAAEGEDAVFTVAASGEGLSYQWQYRANDKAQWTNMSVKTAKLTVEATLEQNGYEYRCVVTDADGNIMISATAKLTVIGTPAVTKLENTAEGIKITWGKVDGVGKYRLYVKNEKGGWSKVADTADTSYVYTAAASGETYTFTVRGMNAEATAFVTGYNTAGWSKLFVAQPTVSKLESVNGGIKITWKAVAGAEKYRIFVKSGSGWKTLDTTAATSYTFTDVEGGETYTFTVRCMDAKGNFTSSYNGNGWQHRYVEQPAISGIENAVDGVKITWKAVTGAEKYRIFVKSGTGGWKTLTDTAGTSFVWTEAVSGETYTFTVRCLDAEGSFTSGYNSSGWKHTFVGAPAVSGFENTASGIKITWGAVTGAGKYRIYIKNAKGGWSKLADTADTAYVYTDAEAGETYTFTIRAMNADGTEVVSAYNTSGWQQTYVAPPEITGFENTADGLKLTWDAEPGAGKYRIYIKNAKGGWTKVADTADTSYVYTAAELGETYTFTLRAMNADGSAFVSSYNGTGWSSAYAPVPAYTQLASEVDGIRLTWDAINGAEKYRVYVKNANGGWSKVGDTTGTSYVYTAAELGKTYTFTIRCLTADGKSYTSTYNGSGWKHTFKPVPAYTKLESAASGIKLTWDAINGAEKYRVYVKNANGGWSKVADTTGTSYVYTAAELGKTYTFTIRCLTADGKSYTTGYNATGWSHKYSPAPSVSKLESTGDGVKITWGAINGAAKYRVFVKTASGWSKVGDTTGTSFTWTGAETNTSYTFTVRCVSADGKSYTSTYNTTGWSVKYNPAPAITKLENASNGVKITWDAINGAGKYRVFVKTDSGWSKVGDTTGTSFTWTGAKKGNTYTFTVRCMSADGKSYISAYNTSGWSYTYK